MCTVPHVMSCIGQILFPVQCVIKNKIVKVCVPGERLCSVEDCISGAGTYQRHGSIFASLAGYVIRRNEGEEVRNMSKCDT